MKTTKAKTYIMITDVICDLGDLQEKLENLRNDLWDAMTKKQHQQTYDATNWEQVQKCWEKQNAKEKI